MNNKSSKRGGGGAVPDGSPNARHSNRNQASAGGTEAGQQVDTDIVRRELERNESSQHRVLEPVKRTVESHKTATVVLAGAAVAATLAALYYTGSKGRDRREKAKRWMHDAKDEVARRVEHTAELTREGYDNIVQSVAGSYESAGATEWDVHSFKEDLTSFWDEYADVIDEAKHAGKDVVVMIAEKLRDAETTNEAAHDIRESLRQTAKAALRGAALGTGKAAHEQGSKQGQHSQESSTGAFADQDTFEEGERH